MGSMPLLTSLLVPPLLLLLLRLHSWWRDSALLLQWRVSQRAETAATAVMVNSDTGSLRFAQVVLERLPLTLCLLQVDVVERTARVVGVHAQHRRSLRLLIAALVEDPLALAEQRLRRSWTRQHASFLVWVGRIVLVSCTIGEVNRSVGRKQSASQADYAAGAVTWWRRLLERGL